VELSRCAALLIGAGRPAPGIEAVTRAALEAGSVAWWLLEDGLTARPRVCRMQLLRRNSARELTRSIQEVGENPAVVGTEQLSASSPSAALWALHRSRRTAASSKARPGSVTPRE
jgi:hypothetical protein